MLKVLWQLLRALHCTSLPLDLYASTYFNKELECMLAVSRCIELCYATVIIMERPGGSKFVQHLGYNVHERRHCIAYPTIPTCD